MAHVPVGWAGRLGRSPGASGVHGAEAAPAHRAPTYLRLGPKIQLTACPADGHSLRRQFRRIGCSLPARHTGHLGYHHGCHCRSPFSGHCTGVSMSTHRFIRGPCTARRWQLRPPGQPGAFLPAAWAEAQLTACLADGILTQAIPTELLLSLAWHTGHPATPRMPLPQSIRSLYRPVDVHSPLHPWPLHGCRWQLWPPGQPGASTCGLGRSSSSQRARPIGHSLRRQFHRIACSLPARHTGHRGYPPRIPLPQSILRSLYRPVDVHSPHHPWPARIADGS